MQYRECYHLCNKYHNQMVRIHDKKGTCHVGRIVKVTDDSVWIQPISCRGRYNRGFGYGPGGYDGYDGYYDGYYGGAVYELAFGFIVGIALASLFFF